MSKFLRLLSVYGFVGILAFGGVLADDAGKWADHTAANVMHASGDGSETPQSPGDGIGWD
ncbi:hypothetical protein ABZ619_14805 [Streptomyces sp. NPDC007851]|uniref:hypothetical protein n=1 Tax=Streptomyces sp. NPDC007851 TaxID=3155008 RepID=UPI0033EB433B